MKRIGIYKITSPSGKVYIGKSVDIDNRWRKYTTLNCKTQRKLYNSLLSHSPDNHTFEILEECEENQLSLMEYTYYQKHVDDGCEMLNIAIPNPNGDGVGRHSEETRRKISEARKGKYTGENNPNWGKKGKDHPKYGSGAFYKELTTGFIGTASDMESRFGIHRVSISMYAKRGTPLNNKPNKGLHFIILQNDVENKLPEANTYEELSNEEKILLSEGKKHIEESKRKQSESRKGINKGKNSGRYGKGNFYKEITTGFIGTSSDMQDKFGINRASISMYAKRGTPLSIGKNKGLYFVVVPKDPK